MIDSVILRTAARGSIVVFMLLSLFVLLRGHNEPGGGFIGGLLAAAGFALFAMAYSVEKARRVLRVDPRTFVGLGAAVILVSSVWPMLIGDALLTGQWSSRTIPAVGKVSTVLLFDVGVYLVVLGAALLILFTAAEEERP